MLRWTRPSIRVFDGAFPTRPRFLSSNIPIYAQPVHVPELRSQLVYTGPADAFVDVRSPNSAIAFAEPSLGTSSSISEGLPKTSVHGPSRILASSRRPNPRVASLTSSLTPLDPEIHDTKSTDHKSDNTNFCPDASSTNSDTLHAPPASSFPPSSVDPCFRALDHDNTAKPLMTGFASTRTLHNTAANPESFSNEAGFELAGDPPRAGLTILRTLYEDVDAAWQLYNYARTSGIAVPVDIPLALIDTLLAMGDIERAIQCLDDPGMSVGALRKWLANVIWAWHPEAQTHSSHASSILLSAFSVAYATKPPSLSLRSRIEHTLLISSAHNANVIKATDVVLRVHRKDPSFFTQRFLTEMLQLILKARQFRVAVNLLIKITDSHPTMATEWRRLVLGSLSRAGATSLALYADQMTKSHRCHDDPTLVMARNARFQVVTPTAWSTLRAVRELEHVPPHARDALYQHTLGLLARAGRMAAARRLYARVRGIVSAKVQTDMGNILVHAAVDDNKMRGKYEVARVLATVRTLVRSGGFVPDRVTLNIVVKALVRWRSVDAPQLRRLFDHLVRIGYPGGSSRQRAGGVPFKSAPALAQHGDNVVQILGELRGSIKFERHVRPLYKTFIKAFHIRGDATAAGMVIGILKEAQAEADVRAVRRSMRDRDTGT